MGNSGKLGSEDLAEKTWQRRLGSEDLAERTWQSDLDSILASA
jgi:hypothetical protein